MLLVLLVCGLLVSLVSIPMVKYMLTSCNLIRKNYRGEMIPVGMGIAFIPGLIVNGALLTYFNVESDRLLLIFVLLFAAMADRKSTRLNSSHANISYAVFCLKKKHTQTNQST